MKVCIIQPPYSLDFTESDAHFHWEMDALDRCDPSMDLIVLPESANVPCLAKTKARGALGSDGQKTRTAVVDAGVAVPAAENRAVGARLHGCRRKVDLIGPAGDNILRRPFGIDMTRTVGLDVLDLGVAVRHVGHSGKGRGGKPRANV